MVILPLVDDTPGDVALEDNVLDLLVLPLVCEESLVVVVVIVGAGPVQTNPCDWPRAPFNDLEQSAPSQLFNGSSPG